MGVGGVSEGVISACGIKALGGTMLCRLAPQSEPERAAIQDAGLDTSRIMTCDDLVSGMEIFFVATGVTDGTLMSGVHYLGDYAQTESIVLRGSTKTRRLVVAEHAIE